MKYDLASALVGLNCSTAHFVGLNNTAPFSNEYNLSKKSLVKFSHSVLFSLREPIFTTPFPHSVWALITCSLVTIIFSFKTSSKIIN